MHAKKTNFVERNAEKNTENEKFSKTKLKLSLNLKDQGEGIK